jgi:hypothetical protein
MLPSFQGQHTLLPAARACFEAQTVAATPGEQRGLLLSLWCEGCGHSSRACTSACCGGCNRLSCMHESKDWGQWLWRGAKAQVQTLQLLTATVVG